MKKEKEMKKEKKNKKKNIISFFALFLSKRKELEQRELEHDDANIIRTHHNLIENIKYYQKLYESKYNIRPDNSSRYFNSKYKWINPQLNYFISLFPISKKYGLTFEYTIGPPFQTQGDVIEYVRKKILKEQTIDLWDTLLFPHNVTDTEIEHEIKLLSYVLDEYVFTFSAISAEERLEQLCGENMDLIQLNISYKDRTKSLFG